MVGRFLLLLLLLHCFLLSNLDALFTLFLYYLLQCNLFFFNERRRKIITKTMMLQNKTLPMVNYKYNYFRDCCLWNTYGQSMDSIISFTAALLSSIRCSHAFFHPSCIAHEKLYWLTFISLAIVLYDDVSFNNSHSF